MLRVPLEQGNVIQLNNQNYTVEAVKGDGANCIVYSAHYMDTVGRKHRIYLKECYPYSASIIRQNYGLLWESEEEQQRAFSSFRAAYEKLMIWQNENFSVSVFDLCKANNTLYIIMNADKGTTFDQDNADSLHDILKTIKLLAHFVGRYHENGYLHLDIKPSNFLVYPRPSEHIVLFDMDSVTPISDIENGNVEFISYSEGWAAPEQKQGKISKLCRATDIYSIGAILFETVMGRPVTVFDTGVYADWDFEGHYFEQVNPQIKAILKKVFKHTLSATINRRYQSTDELESDLDSIIRILAAGEPYLLPENISCTADFVGRKEELAAIDQAFETGAHIVCLTGMGGIGKSELAKSYAQKACFDSTLAVFVTYRGISTIDDILCEIKVQRFTGTKDEKLTHVKQLLSDDVLLVVDGLDSKNIPDLSELEKLQCRILITSRFSWKDYGYPTIHVGPLTSDEQTLLFEQAYGQSLLEYDRILVREILGALEGYTLLIPLLAKQMKKGLYSFEDVLNRIRTAGLSSISEGKVRHSKDSVPIAKPLYGILREVLNMANFSESEISVMRNLAMLRNYKIKQQTFIAMVGREHIEQIFDLLDNNWIVRSNEHATFTLELHPVIADLCCDCFSPNFENCRGIADYFKTLAEHIAQSLSVYTTDLNYDLKIDDFDRACDNAPTYELIESEVRQVVLLLSGLDCSEINLHFCIDILYTMLNGNINVLNQFGAALFKYVIRWVAEGEKMGSLDDGARYKALNILLTAWCSDNPPIFEAEKAKYAENLPLEWSILYGKIVSDDCEYDENRAEVFENAIAAALQLDKSEQETAIYKAFLPAVSCIHAQLDLIKSVDSMKLAAAIQRYAHLLPSESQNMPLGAQISLIAEYLSSYDAVDEESAEWANEEDRPLTEEENREFALELREGMCGPSPDQLCQILNNAELSDLEKARQISFSQPFNEWFYKSEDYNAERWLRKINWAYIGEALDIQSELLWTSKEEWEDEGEELFSDEELFGIVAAKRAVVAAILDDKEFFDAQTKMLLEKYIRDMDDSLIDPYSTQWYRRPSTRNPFGCLINAMRCIHKTHWLIPDMLYLPVHLKELYLKARGETEKAGIQQVLLNYYDLLCELLDEAIRETGDPDQTFSKLRSQFRAIVAPTEGNDDFLFPRG